MSHYKKLYDKIKNNPKNVDFKDIDKLLTKVGGFTRRNPKGGSSHYTYSHPDLPNIITIPKDKPLKPIYVKNALEAFEMVKEEF
ncbi:MAG: Addiction module toxin, HicA family [Xylanivirga thermophila]|jgi:predicted RNA binding protein YcfA (HicA-like mRNA interferase family)|uniref:type II toxin-antitoxin system HicA family toxin n=1 Tax=Xylanivirga thermophila TaxID=2496273 RepID=UPI0039F53DA1